MIYFKKFINSILDFLIKKPNFRSDFDHNIKSNDSIILVFILTIFLQV